MAPLYDGMCDTVNDKAGNPIADSCPRGILTGPAASDCCGVDFCPCNGDPADCTNVAGAGADMCTANNADGRRLFDGSALPPPPPRALFARPPTFDVGRRLSEGATPGNSACPYGNHPGYTLYDALPVEIALNYGGATVEFNAIRVSAYFVARPRHITVTASSDGGSLFDTVATTTFPMHSTCTGCTDEDCSPTFLDEDKQTCSAENPVAFHTFPLNEWLDTTGSASYSATHITLSFTGPCVGQILRRAPPPGGWIALMATEILDAPPSPPVVSPSPPPPTSPPPSAPPTPISRRRRWRLASPAARLPL